MLARLPTSLPGMAAFRWVRQVHRADHFRAVWRWAWDTASTEERAQTVGMLLVGGLAATGAVVSLSWGGEALLRMVRFGPTAGKEAAVGGLIFLVCGAGLYALGRLVWPRVRVLEARPGILRFGPHAFAATRVRAVRLVRRKITQSTLDPVLGGTITTRHILLEVLVVPHRGAPQRVWRAANRGAGPAARWVRAMAQVAGVPVEDAPPSRADA